MAQAPITFAGSANAGLNVAVTELPLSTPAAVALQNGSSWLIDLIANLPAGAYSSFNIRMGPAGTASDNLICSLQNNIISFSQAQTDANNWANSFAGLPPQFYSFPANGALQTARTGGGLAQAQLIVTLTNISSTTNQGTVSVYNTQPANAANPLVAAGGLVGSNTVVANSTMLLTVTGMIGNGYSVTSTLAPLTLTVANVVFANGSMTSVVNGSN